MANGRRKLKPSNPIGTIQTEILTVLKGQKYMSADDIHRRLHIPKECMKFVAPAFRGLQANGVIQMVTIRKTSRADQGKNRIGLWKLVTNRKS